MSYNFKVVTRKGNFFVAELSATGMAEAHASLRARKALLATVGQVNGGIPGLTEGLARGLCARLSRRPRSPRRRR